MSLNDLHHTPWFYASCKQQATQIIFAEYCENWQIQQKWMEHDGWGFMGMKLKHPFQLPSRVPVHGTDINSGMHKKWWWLNKKETENEKWMLQDWNDLWQLLESTFVVCYTFKNSL